MLQRAVVYGLGVETNLAMAGLAGLPEPGQVDVRIHLRDAPATFADWHAYYESEEQDDGVPAVRVSRNADPDAFRIEYVDGTVVYVDGPGREVWATWPHPATVEDTATYLLGPTLGFVLRLRGITCLHASVVAIDDRAVAFAGPAGAGKSTLAAAFARRGHAILTDDVAPLVESADCFRVAPAYPRVRLWPESAASLFGRAESLPLITPTWEKRFLPLDGDRFFFESRPLELAAIYLLADRADDGPRIEAVASRDALMSLVANTYTNYLLDRGMRAAEFQVLGRLVDRIAVRRAVPARDLAAIDALCDAVLADLHV